MRKIKEMKSDENKKFSGINGQNFQPRKLNINFKIYDIKKIKAYRADLLGRGVFQQFGC